jgi:hypothetical protein
VPRRSGASADSEDTAYEPPATPNSVQSGARHARSSFVCNPGAIADGQARLRISTKFRASLGVCRVETKPAAPENWIAYEPCLQIVDLTRPVSRRFGMARRRSMLSPFCAGSNFGDQGQHPFERSVRWTLTLQMQTRY